MARLPRLIVPGYPHHIVQRGNNRQAIFVDDSDRKRYLSLLIRSAQTHHLAIHAYVLMPNHVHLLATPPDESAVAATMQAIGRAYVRWFNRRHQRTGTLFEGRFRSCVVQSDHYLLACTRYIEMNPVRAKLVESPEAFRWSSHRHHIGLAPSAFITEHETMWALGNTPFERQSSYRKMFESPIGEQALTDIRTKLNKGRALGSPTWVEELSRSTSLPVLEGKPGRPARGHQAEDANSKTQ